MKKTLIRAARYGKRAFRALAERHYPSWKDAEIASEQTYNAELLNRFRVEREWPLESNATPNSILAKTVRSLSLTAPHVVDFGGGTGSYGKSFMKSFPDAIYEIIENETLVSLAGDKTPCSVNFSIEIPSSFDVFYTSGTLQYIEKYRKILELAFSRASHAVILMRNCFSEEPIYRVQKSYLFDNGSGPIPKGYINQIIRYPHQTVSKKAILDSAADHEFALSQTVPSNHGVLKCRKKVYGEDLVFLKKQGDAVSSAEPSL